MKLFLKKRVLILIVVIVLAITSCCVFINLFSPKIVLKDEKEVIINYKAKYIEPGYLAKYKNKNITKKVVVSGKVNTNKLGTYKITYKVKNGIFTGKIIRKVKVKDTEKPTLKIVGDKKAYVCPGKEYKKEKYRAFDNYDKDISDNVIYEKKGGEVTYTVKDSSGNTTVVNKKIHYKDIEGPKINIKSDYNTFVFVNEEYKIPEYSVTDNCDKDIKVEVEGSVDTSTVGVYTMTYKASDKYGNKSVEKRIINVVNRGINGTIYLTFDDGPREGITDEILNILKDENIKATFFVTNSGPDELIKRAYDEGHTIALHTATHDYSQIYASVDNYFKDLTIVHDRVYNITGYDSKIIRFPGGSSNTISRRYRKGIMSELVREVINKGYRYYDWNVLSGDAGEVDTADGVYNNVINRISKEKVNIVLMHDIKIYTRDALKNIIKYGKDNGYIFDKIDESTEMMVQKVNN